MNPDHRTNNTLTNQRGVAAIIVALAIAVLLGMAALAVDIGYLNVAKNELQNIVDASALAGTGELSRQYLDPSFTAVDESLIVAIADNVANSNASGFTIQVQIGTWIDRATGFDATPVTKPNAVRAIARRGSGGNSQVPTFFAKIWNVVGLDAQADAVAALTGLPAVGEGELELPLGISKTWFEKYFCDKDITFYPTSGEDGCAAWHNYEEWPASNSKIAGKLVGLTDGSFVPPAVDLIENPEAEFSFIGGNLSGLKEEMWDLYDAKKDPITGLWETKVVVYDEPCGENPNKTIKITGFATVVVSKIIGPPIHLIVTAKCGIIYPGAGGGNYYGTWGSIPGLVE